MTPAEVAAHFTRSDGTYVFARWGRPIAPVVFGVEDATLATIKAALRAVAQMAGHAMTDIDPQLGVNLMLFYIRAWDELRHVPDLDRLILGLAPLVDRLERAGANQYRIFRFDAGGGIRACIDFVRLDVDMAATPAATLALMQAVQVILLWSDGAFTDRSPLVLSPGGDALLRPGIGTLIRAAYDPVLPVQSRDPAHALRLAARIAPSS